MGPAHCSAIKNGVDGDIAHVSWSSQPSDRAVRPNAGVWDNRSAGAGWAGPVGPSARGHSSSDENDRIPMAAAAARRRQWRGRRKRRHRCPLRPAARCGCRRAVYGCAGQSCVCAAVNGLKLATVGACGCGREGR